ncbi:MAG: alpha/beta fold hydrolase [Fidelibacterota bacterium]|nr:MAG: alpha/beta fold hydrolase [Candidatus Neomarinimicrobiota bacterium]
MIANINGHSLNYVVRGTKDGLPVVFIHGFPFSHRMWQPQLEALPHRYRAVAYDVRGHGDSEVGHGQYTVELFVDDLIGLLDHLAVNQAVVCGLSMGGYIALRAVERHPERFRGLVLCDTRSEADTDEAKVKRAGTIAAVRSLGVAPFAEEFVKLVLAPRTIEANPSVVKLVKGMITGTDPLGICGTLLALAARTDTTPALSAMNLPALVLVGEHDVLTPPVDAQAMARALPEAALHVIPDAAHMSNLENPAVFNERLLGFLERF